jgi:methyltransferase (TIGR00027 family)
MARCALSSADMHEQKPSRTALRVAIRRAEHQVFDRATVFEDPLAVSIIGPEAAAELEQAKSLPERTGSHVLRAFMAVRSRFAEDELARAVGQGVRQYVVLGAGLDTFAYRNPHTAAGLRVFELDHPATQAWKRERLQRAGIAIPPEAVLAPIDFERETIGQALDAAGFRSDDTAFFSWLGVVPYLTDAAFAATIAYVGARPATSRVVFDYALARSNLGVLERIAFDALARRVAAAGEPFQLFFTPEDLRDRLRAAGFGDVEDLGAAELNARYFVGRAHNLRLKTDLAHLVCAQV